jgi:hypothetical protein
MNPWGGPYKVVDVLGDTTYGIQQSPKSKKQIVHFNRLKPYEGTEMSWGKAQNPISKDVLTGDYDNNSNVNESVPPNLNISGREIIEEVKSTNDNNNLWRMRRSIRVRKRPNYLNDYVTN